MLGELIFPGAAPSAVETGVCAKGGWPDRLQSWPMEAQWTFKGITYLPSTGGTFLPTGAFEGVLAAGAPVRSSSACSCITDGRGLTAVSAAQTPPQPASPFSWVLTARRGWFCRAMPLGKGSPGMGVHFWMLAVSVLLPVVAGRELGAASKIEGLSPELTRVTLSVLVERMESGVRTFASSSFL